MKLIFVYNADGTLWGRVSDFTHKIVSPSTYSCNLCKLTYGNFAMEKQWKKFIASLPCEVEFLHADEFRKKYANAPETDFPCVFRQEDKLELFISAVDINKANSLEELISIVSSKVRS